jgi:uncharacterized RDD family membrane protein YckC
MYATFPRRLNALTTDTATIVCFLIVVVFLVPVVEEVDALRITLFLVCCVVLFLYEPTLVSRFGGTLGHMFQNLRVVDSRTGGNVPFWKAVVRFWLKAVLGVFSFLSMAFTKRHQAIHDLLTASTVQIRDPEKAKPHHYTMRE